MKCSKNSFSRDFRSSPARIPSAYKEPLDRRWGGERAQAGNLYQIFSYVTNWTAGAGAGEREPEGRLLYATVDGGFDYRFELVGRPVRVRSVDLGQEWKGIERMLKGLVACRAVRVASDGVTSKRRNGNSGCHVSAPEFAPAVPYLSRIR